MIISCFADEISPLLYEQARVLRALGIHAVQFRSAWNVNVLEMNEWHLREAQHLLAGEGLRVACLGSAVGKTDLDRPPQTEREQMKRALAAADILQTDRIRGFTFFPAGHDRDESLAEVTERVGALAVMAKAAGKTLLLESEKDVIADTSLRLKAVLDGIGMASCRAVLDASNLLSVGERPSDESLPRLLPYVADVHVKDSLRETGEKVLVGQGDAQWREILGALCAQPDLSLTLEPHLSYAGLYRGFTGEAGFRTAAEALFALLTQAGIDRQ